MPWIGPAFGLAGGLLSSSGGNSGPATTNTAPWLEAQPYLRDLFARAQQYSQQPAVSPLAQQGINAQAQRAQQGNPLLPAAQQSLMPTLQGAYLDPATNPAWGALSSRLADAYSTGTAAQTDAAFARAGAFGSGNSAYDQTVQRNQRSFGDSLAQLAANIYGGERTNQMNAAQVAPGLAAADYGDIQQLQQAGQAPQNALQQQLAAYSSLISGHGGGQTQQSLFSNPGASFLGGAATGYGLYNAWNHNQQPATQPNYYGYGSGNDIASSWLGLPSG